VSTIPIVWAIFPTLHLAHGIGFGTGLIKYALAPDWSSVDEKIPVNAADADGATAAQTASESAAAAAARA
jgi:hypothetical protein